MKVTIAAIQTSARAGEHGANVEQAVRLIQSAAERGAKICLLPELALDEFFPVHKDTKYFAYAEELSGPSVERFRALAGELGIYLALPLFEKSLIGTYYNSLVLLTPGGEIGAVYRKVHVPCTRSYERYYFAPGPEFVVADTAYGKVGMAICYDRRYPETCRELMKLGARLILIPISSSVMPGGFSELPVFETELRTRSFENQLFIAACNRTGKEGEYTFFGNSMIVAPDGTILGRAGEEENAIVMAEIDLEDADAARINGPLLRDRRPDVYTI
ncbi:MAG: carbon-nitrogen hydrolase family protein [Clostridia bacterium]|nr:carbon-nitrogen hydrolase family protein [Clostridia bacterium]